MSFDPLDEGANAIAAPAQRPRTYCVSYPIASRVWAGPEDFLAIRSRNQAAQTGGGDGKCRDARRLVNVAQFARDMMQVLAAVPRFERFELQQYAFELRLEAGAALIDAVPPTPAPSAVSCRCEG